MRLGFLLVDFPSVHHVTKLDIIEFSVPGGVKLFEGCFDLLPEDDARQLDYLKKWHAQKAA